ncbi:MAG: 2-amino-4-hydroxy-6-hydroxymethyldihydropteridine diphosphokinase [Candidatus Kapabacteria bacterium]|jgi:2-amino-4-hydroxy-6-hydroxymethyldihydropteridine diphosphokinase|nr:2-amino-4-hydroxy-6-hydroxymethyldihydropteridine diphosphokinase [Candidatus Kapabacteria bacterium]
MIFSNSENKPVFTMLSLGTNLGDRQANIDTAVRHLINESVLTDVRTSSYYETEPVGFIDQPPFINIVLTAMTKMSLANLMQYCKSVEYFMGRTIRMRWHEREIDIDILLYADTVIHSSRLTIPHPRMHERKFVLVPANEIADKTMHPKLNKSISRLLEECKDNSEVRSLLFKK